MTTLAALPRGIASDRDKGDDVLKEPERGGKKDRERDIIFQSTSYALVTPMWNANVDFIQKVLYIIKGERSK